MSKDNPLIKKNKNKDSEHLKNQVARAPVTTVNKKVPADASTNIRTSIGVKDELNAIVTVKKYTSVNVLLEDLIERYKKDLNDADRELIERLK